MKKGLLLSAVIFTWTLCILVWGAGPVGAQDANKVWTSISAEEMGNILKEMGISFEQSADSDDDPVLSFRLGSRTGGYKTGMLFFKGPEKGRYPRVQLRSSFTTSNPPKLELIYEKLNDWNQKKCFANAYRRPDGGFVFKYDLLIVGGVTTQAIKEFVKNYESLLLDFVTHIGFSR